MQNLNASCHSSITYSCPLVLAELPQLVWPVVQHQKCPPKRLSQALQAEMLQAQVSPLCQEYLHKKDLLYTINVPS